MSAGNNNVALALEHSSRDLAEGLADPDMMWVRTLIVDSPDIADVVKDIFFLKRLSMDADERLQPFLLDRFKAFKYSVASLSSVKGRMLNQLSTTTTAYHYKETSNIKPKHTPKDMLGGGPKN